MWRTHRLVESVDISENRENRENFEPHLTAAATVIFLDNVAAVSLKFATFSRRAATWQQVLNSCVSNERAVRCAAKNRVRTPFWAFFGGVFWRRFCAVRLRFPINNIAALFGNRIRSILDQLSIIWRGSGRSYSHAGHRSGEGGRAKITKLPGFEVRPRQGTHLHFSLGNRS